MEAGKGTSLKNKLCVGSVLCAMAAGAAVPSAAHADGTPQDMMGRLAFSLIQSVATRQLNSSLFPDKGIDYDRIKQDMESATRMAIVDAEIDRASGHLQAATDNSMAALNKSDPLEAFLMLELVRLKLVDDLNVIGSGQFRKPALGAYIQGAQIELGILASERALAVLEDRQREVTANLKDRLKRHIANVAKTRYDIINDNTKANVNSRSGCYSYEKGSFVNREWVINKYWAFDYQGVRQKSYNRERECDNGREDWLVYILTNEVEAEAEKVDWVRVVLANWQKALYAVDSTVNPNTVPFDGTPPDLRVDLRLGDLSDKDRCIRDIQGRYDYYKVNGGKLDPSVDPKIAGTACTRLMRAVGDSIYLGICRGPMDHGIPGLVIDRAGCDSFIR